MSDSTNKYWYVKDGSSLAIIEFTADAEGETIMQGPQEVVTITVDYDYQPAELSDSTLSTEPDLPSKVQEGLAYYAIYRGYLLKKADPALDPQTRAEYARQMQIHLQLYQESIRQARELANKGLVDAPKKVVAPYPFGPGR